MRIHFVSIGGVAMHNLAIALHVNGNHVTGSDDGIFEPSYSKLKKYGLLPPAIGWFTGKITADIDAVITSMHAGSDNPELAEAKRKQIRIYSYPEFLFEHSKDKIRVVIGGSHGKTTITSMIVHVLKNAGIDADFMVGAQMLDFDVMVKLTDSAGCMILEGDENPSSPLDPRPRFLHYQPQIAVISGIAWDHIESFPEYKDYINTFNLFLKSLQSDACLIYNQDDYELGKLVKELKIRKIAYAAHPHIIEKGISSIYLNDENKFKLNIFGMHNMSNISAARLVCKELGVKEDVFYQAISCFKSASRRLELLATKGNSFIYRDFAHAPSKLKATVAALRHQYPAHRLIICYELHSYSSMFENFIDQYNGTLDLADEAIVFYDPKAAVYKNIPLMTSDRIKQGFSRDDIQLFSDNNKMLAFLRILFGKKVVLAFLTSGRFGHVDYNTITLEFQKSDL